MGRDVTDGVMTIALVVVCASGILNAPAAFVAMVTIRAVAVFSALRRTFSINASLPRQTFALARGVGTVASIVNGPNADWSYRPEVELFVEGGCPLESLFTLALVVALRIIDPTRELQARACGALKETSLVSWTTLPESAAVLGMLMVVWNVMVGVDVFRTIRNLTTIIRKAILSRENTIWPC